MSLLQKKQMNQCSAGCMVMKWSVGLLLLITTIASLVGVYQTHILMSSGAAKVVVQFGSSSGSFAIIAFTVSVTALLKQMVCCMSGSCEVCSK